MVLQRRGKRECGEKGEYQRCTVEKRHQEKNMKNILVVGSTGREEIIERQRGVGVT